MDEDDDGRLSAIENTSNEQVGSRQRAEGNNDWWIVSRGLGKLLNEIRSR
ncbi:MULTISPECIES: hypothetical protein [Actinoalloteichus]|uniref:Uncharacterized protein n=1 Tax=Actinoalloteichus caeruleus DSM 43889 TaxID=1120930 RepID=A0ABT1JFX1_ACTCY|nr:hypothetical protein [Actinoalloteichus caeruleus]MCP2330671.1 hypothetical protein [Actinoalloteichus caeruleus DSM 43889]